MVSSQLLMSVVKVKQAAKVYYNHSAATRKQWVGPDLHLRAKSIMVFGKSKTNYPPHHSPIGVPFSFCSAQFAPAAALAVARVRLKL